MKNKILYFSTADYSNPSAQLVHIIKMSSALKNYFKVDLFLYNFDKSENLSEKFQIKKEPRYFSKKLYSNIPIALQSLWNLLFLVKKNKYSHVFTRNVVIAYACSLLRIDFIYEAHDCFRGFYKNLFEHAVLKSKNLKLFITISNSLKQDYKTLFDTNSTVLHDAADKLDMDIQIREKAKNVFYIGSLYRGRGLELIEFLANENKDLNFHVIGGSGKNLDNLKFWGYLNQKEIKEKVLEADILLMPYAKSITTNNNGLDTTRWMSPMKMFEYMSYGLPIISSDIKVLREVLNDKNSILVEPENEIKWDNALKKLAKNFSLRKSIAHEAKFLLEKKYTWATRAERVKDELNT